MGRLTNVNPDGHWTVKGADGKPLRWEEIERNLYGALCKLKDYEDTDLSPEQVENMKADKAWIPVSEGLPSSPYDNVLAFVYGKAGNAHFEGAYLNAFYDPACGWGLEDYPEAEELRVTHWMPFPEPPKGVK